VIRTGRAEADHDLDAVIRGTRANPDFALSISQANHRARCRAIDLGGDLIRYIRSGEFLTDGQGSPGSGAPTDDPGEQAGYINDFRSDTQGGGEIPDPTRASNSHTPIRNLRCVSFRLSEREAAFVEAVLVLVLHKLQIGELARDGVVKLTNRQIMEVASDRRPEVTWVSDRQIEREKRKFIGRPGDRKPASKFELLQEVRKGERKRGETVGTPSEYLPTGINLLLWRAAEWITPLAA
jgi:hypothetical protein